MPTTNGTNYYNRPNIRILDALVSPPGPVALTAPLDGAINVNENPSFGWSAPTTGGIHTGYKLYVHPLTDDFTGVEPILVSTTTYTPAVALDYSTLYYWKVVATNGAADSPDSTVWSFTVRDDPTITPDYCLDFGTLTTDWPVLNWTQLTGPYGGPLVAGTQWYQDDWRNVLDPVNKCAKINIYGTTRRGWLVSPPVNIPATGEYEIKFDACLVLWNNSTAPTTTQEDDRFLVVMGDTPTMDNPVILGEWNNTGSPLVFNGIPAEGATYNVPITATGIKYFAFYGESTVTGNGDNDLMIDNLCIQQVVPGITSYQAAAAHTGRVLVESGESLAVVSGVAPEAELEAVLGAAQAVTVLGALGRGLDGPPHEPHGIHVDAGPGGADIDRTADSFRG